jgi:hypothetical protein
MEQQQQSMPGHHSFQRQPRTSSCGQRMFWSSFWLPFGLAWFLAFLFNSWWQMPLSLSLPILFAGYVALLVVAVRHSHQFQRADSPSPPRTEPKESWEEQAQPSEVSSFDFADPQPFPWETEHLQVPDPGQE